MDEHDYERDADRCNYHRQQRREEGNVRCNKGTAGCPASHNGIEGWKFAEHVRSVRETANGVPLEECADDFGKAKCRDREVVAFEPEHWETDEKREKRRENTCEDQRYEDAEEHSDACVAAKDPGENFLKRELDNPAVKILVDRCAVSGWDHQYAVSVGSDQHESGLSQREEPGEAIQQVHGNCDNGVDGCFLQDYEDHR